jgi:hypothetical protein
MSKLRFEASANAGPIFVGSYEFGDTVESWEPDVGNSATLHIGNVTVIARITGAKDRQYEAEVVGLENCAEYECEGLKPGDRVEFSYRQMIGCSR